MFAEIDLSGAAELASEIGVALWAFGMTPAGKVTYMFLGLLYVVGMARSSVLATTGGVRWTAGLFHFGKVSEVCQNACKLLLGGDTQTDQKKLGIDAMGQAGHETTVKAGLLVVTLETGGIVLHGADLSAKLGRRERRRILSVARYVRKRILATEREQGRQVAAHLLKVMTVPAPTNAVPGEVYHVPVQPNGARSLTVEELRAQEGRGSLSPATRRLDEGCGSSGNGKPVACPGCR